MAGTSPAMTKSCATRRRNLPSKDARWIRLHLGEQAKRHPVCRGDERPHRRVYEHKSRFVAGFTRKYSIKRLVYFEHHETIQAAIQREHNMKHWSRKWKVRLILADNPEWNDLYETIT